MKKALSVVLAMLMVFSMVGVMAFAEETESDVVTFIFLNDNGEVFQTITATYDESGKKLVASAALETPVKEDTDTTKYVFKGWIDDADNLYYQNTYLDHPAARLGATIVLTAAYMEEEISVRQSFLNFIESIFERINLIFEYFALVFQW